jgi:hypothetical protein
VRFVCVQAQRERVSTGVRSVVCVCDLMVDSLAQWHAGESIRVHSSCIV